MTRYHLGTHLGGSIEFWVYKEKGHKHLGVSKLIARTCHLCLVFHCQVVISTSSSIPEFCYVMVNR